MASSFKLQIPADVHCLAQLLVKLGYSLGPMKAAQIKEGVVDLWFVRWTGVKRARARLVRGNSEVRRGHPRRVYLDLRVQFSTGEWWVVRDEDYQAVGLLPPWEYDGVSFLAVEFDTARGIATWDGSGSGSSLVYYYQHLSGDRDRAISEAKELIAAFNRGE